MSFHLMLGQMVDIAYPTPFVTQHCLFMSDYLSDQLLLDIATIKPESNRFAESLGISP